MPVRQIKTFSEFQSAINQGTTFVDFFTTWCGPCKMLSPIIDELSEEIPNIKFLKVDIDQLHEVSHAFRIQSIPTIMLFKDGQMINSFLGYRPKDEILKFIEQNH